MPIKGSGRKRNSHRVNKGEGDSQPSRSFGQHPACEVRPRLRNLWAWLSKRRGMIKKQEGHRQEKTLAVEMLCIRSGVWEKEVLRQAFEELHRLF